MKNIKLITLISVLAIISIFTIGHLVTLASPSATAGNNSSLKSALEDLNDGVTPILIKFISPVQGEEFWSVPLDFKNTDGALIGRRLIQAIGEDYLYIEEIGQGATFKFYIPFSNIAFVTSP